MIEVERKCWILNKKKILAFLYKNAVLKTEVTKNDFYYIEKSNNNKSIICENDKIFRVRLLNNKYFATFKEKSLKNKTEINIENEFEIIDNISFIKFINYLGFTKLIEKTKESKIFIIDNVTLEYNYLHNLGYFLEAEIICEKKSQIDSAISKINKIFNKMGINKKDIESKTYIELLLERMYNERI